ncbi:MAG: ATP-dependent Clp protease adaptor ClpS [Saprospiraceae bacterium]|nr:ATP-dependent Clp protease adaptor ClpS [Saprospiraceae bacterium]
MMNSQSKPWQDLDDDVLVEEITGDISEIVVYNDDVNTFDWVIESFMEVCKHSFEQAEQLSMMVHFKGKASVKRGVFDILRPMKDALCERGLSAVIETIKV